MSFLFAGEGCGLHGHMVLHSHVASFISVHRGGLGFLLPAESEHHSWVTVQVISMEGYGTDAYLHINRLGNSEEPLR